MAGDRPRTKRTITEKTRTQQREPDLFQVLLLNDDYTTMEFVVQVLETIFLMHPAEAFRVMMQVHQNGRGICGAYPLEIAETKVGLVHGLARERGFPLRASLEDE